MKNKTCTPVARPLLCCFVVAVGVNAQPANLMLEEVVVTAQKREQSLQEVPIAITALDADALEVKGITDTDSFAHYVPNLHIKQGAGSGVTLSIRGISNNFPSNSGFEAAVGLYVDGMYVGNGFGTLFDLGDVERVEVLRGPQGTLYGRNTIGGAINLISTRPAGDWGGKLRAGLGSEGLKTAVFALDTPAIGAVGEGLGEIALRVSGFLRERDGVTRNVEPATVITGALPLSDTNRLGSVDRSGARIALDWRVVERFSLSYDYTLSRVDDVPRLFQVRDVDRSRPAPQPRPPGFEQYVVDGHASSGSTNIDPLIESDSDSHMLALQWDLTDTVTVKSMTGYRETDLVELVDADGSNLSFFESNRIYGGEQFSQELQLLGGTDSLNYVMGYYYFTEEGKDAQARQFGPFIIHSTSFVDNRNSAVFGQLDWTPPQLEQWTLSLGARRTWEEKGMDRYIAFFPGGTGTFAPQTDAVPNLTNPDIKFNNTSVMLSAAYEVNEGVRLYAKYAEGFRSGGYDGNTINLVAASTPFASEEVKTYELGMKSRWMDNKVEINAAIFHSDYTDMQLTSFDGAVAFTVNAGEAELQGAEIELTALFSDRLRAAVAYSYLDYEFNKFDMGTVGDVSGTAALNNAPENTLNVSLDYEIARLNTGTVSLNLNYNYSSEADALAVNNDGSRANATLDSRGIVDFRLAWGEIPISGGEMQVALWGKNVTDEEYYDNVIPFAASNTRNGTLGWPAMYGIEAIYKF